MKHEMTDRNQNKILQERYPHIMRSMNKCLYRIGTVSYTHLNPNVSYYTYIATIPDKTVKVSDEDWLTISLTNNTQSKGIVLDRAFVRSENGASYVYKDDNGVLKKQVLTVGGNVNGGYSVLITGGITRDYKIAFPYCDTVKEGAKTKEVSSSEIYGY